MLQHLSHNYMAHRFAVFYLHVGEGRETVEKTDGLPDY